MRAMSASFGLAPGCRLGDEQVGIMASPPSVNVARLTYLLICEAAGIAIALSTRGTMFEIPLSTAVVAGLAVAGLVIWIETLMRGFTLRGFSTATFGLGVGLFCAWLLTRVEISKLLEIPFRSDLGARENTEDFVDAIRLAFDVTLFASLGFLGAVLALRSNRDDFAFIIPYVRFRQDAASGQPVVLDAELVIDGRVEGILRSGFLRGRLIVPRFVLESLRLAAASGTGNERQRAEQALERLDRMQKSADLQLTVHDTQSAADADATADARWIEICRLLGARLMTMDEQLARVARIQGVDVLSIQELDEALRPAVVPGQRIRLALVRAGKEDHQAVGYLSDGTLIVVNHGAAKIGTTAQVVVTGTLQTGNGTMVFAELDPR
jgi:uncharacterized protein YacL